MDRIFWILTVAQSGLKTASGLLNQRSKQQTAAAAKEADAKKKAALLNDAKRTANLAKVLSSADAGIDAYLLAA